MLVGQGPASTPLVIALGEAGWSVALIERERFAATCINEGCTSNNAMIATREMIGVVVAGLAGCVY